MCDNTCVKIHRDGIAPVRVEASFSGCAQQVLNSSFPQRLDQVSQAFIRGDVLNSFGEPIGAGEKVAIGEVIYVFRPVLDEPSEPIKPVVLAETERWIAIDKPAGMATMPRGTHVAQSATIVVRRFLANPEVVAAHRLDAATRGVLLIVKDARWRGTYQRLFQEGRVQKSYCAVASVLHEDGSEPRFTREEEIALRLVKERSSLQTRVEKGEVNARTRIRLVREAEDRALYEVHPLSGKTHQIRVTFSHLGIPIEGDWLYPLVMEKDSGNLQLLASELGFIDPVDRREVTIKSEQKLDF